MTLRLNSRPDGFGWIYGDWISPEGEPVRVDIMPPVEHWAGDIQLEGYEPHESDWVLYVEGEEVGRSHNIEQIDAAALLVVPKIANHAPGDEGASIVAGNHEWADRVATGRQQHLVRFGMYAIVVIVIVSFVLTML